MKINYPTDTIKSHGYMALDVCLTNISIMGYFMRDIDIYLDGCEIPINIRLVGYGV